MSHGGAGGREPMPSEPITAAVCSPAANVLAEVARLEGVTVAALAQLVLESYAAAQERDSWSVPSPVDWRRTPRRGLYALPRA